MPQKKPVAIPATIDRNQRYSLPECFAILRLSAAQGFREIRAGRLITFRDGKRSYATGAELIRRSKPQAAQPRKPRASHSEQPAA
jgi:hypothetical protein